MSIVWTFLHDAAPVKGIAAASVFVSGSNATRLANCVTAKTMGTGAVVAPSAASTKPASTKPVSTKPVSTTPASGSPVAPPPSALSTGGAASGVDDAPDEPASLLAPHATTQPTNTSKYFVLMASIATETP